MDKLHFLLCWYFSCIIALGFTVFLLIFVSFPHVISTQPVPEYQVFSALPSTATQQQVAIEKADGRAIIIENFYKRLNAPLQYHAETFVSVADKYGLDYRLLPAIAMQESGGGRVIPIDSYNPFGYGVYGDKVMRFPGWDDAIERVGRGIRTDYLDQGLTTPYLIMTKYTPPSLEKGGPWAINVSEFMEAMK
jgi:hypothetical protein